MPDVPYYTTEDESQWCGHIWRQRDRIGGRWGFVWEVLEPYGHEDTAVSCGWRHTQESAEAAMNESLKRHQGEKPNE